MGKSRQTWIRTLAIGAALAGTACTPIIERHGFSLTDRDLAQISPGRTTRAEALAVLPSPTIASSVGGDLYYVSSQFRTFGPFSPKETDRQIVAIDVDERGIITGVTRYGLSDGRAVPLSQRVTDDNIADLNFLTQLMGNVGRIDPASLLGQ